MDMAAGGQGVDADVKFLTRECADTPGAGDCVVTNALWCAPAQSTGQAIPQKVDKSTVVMNTMTTRIELDCFLIVERVQTYVTILAI